MLAFTCMCHAVCLFLTLVGFFWVSGLLLSGICLQYHFIYSFFCHWAFGSLSLIVHLAFTNLLLRTFWNVYKSFSRGQAREGLSLGLGAGILHFSRESGVAFQVVRPCHVLRLVSGDPSWVRPLCLPPVLPKSLHPLLPGGCPPSARTVSVPQVLGHGLRHATLVSHTEETVCWDAPGHCCKNISSDLRQLGREIWGLCFFLCEQGAGGHGCPRQSL